MRMAIKRSASEIKRIVCGYEESGLTRRQYCSRIGIPVTTLDYYRNRSQRSNEAHGAALLPVKLSAPAATLTTNHKTGAPKSGSDFAVVVAEGSRRIESGWGFDDAALARLIRVVETA